MCHGLSRRCLLLGDTTVEAQWAEHQDPRSHCTISTWMRRLWQMLHIFTASG